MPTIEQGVVSRWIAAMEREAAWNMDMLARLSVLEGAAGVAPGTWLRQKSRGFASALDHFGPKLAAAWTATSNQGVYDKALAAAARNLRHSARVDAYDLVQELTSGSTTSSGPARMRLFYSVGEALRKDENALANGEVTPGHRRVLGTIDRWVSRAAMDVYRSERGRKEVPFAGRHKPWNPGEPTQENPFARFDDEERTNLLLLAMQSPGGPGKAVRHIIDEEIDRSFPPKSRQIVRAFLEKIAQPKYRSPQEMKRLMSRFNPAKWFQQVYGLIRKELMKEMGLSPQQVTNALGGNASKVFKFMRERVGKDPRVLYILKTLGDKIELLEPGVARVADDQRSEPDLVDAVLRSWLAQQGPRRNQDVCSSTGDAFEMNEHKEWGELATPHAQHGRGPSPLRVGRRGKNLYFPLATRERNQKNSATVERSQIEEGAQVLGDARVEDSSVGKDAVIEDSAKVVGSEITGKTRVRGNSNISHAKLRGGTWDGVELDGGGGVYHEPYDARTLKILSSLRGASPSPGDGPLRAMRQFFADGGKTEGWLGGELDRKELQKKVQRHVYDKYDREDPWLGRGASFLDELSDEDFEHLAKVAEREADEMESEERKKKAMLHRLIKMAYERPEFRGSLMPLIRRGREERVASGASHLRGATIRVAYGARDPELKKALLEVLKDGRYLSEAPTEAPRLMMASELRQTIRKAYETRDPEQRKELLGLLKQAKYSPGFMKYVEKKKWKHPQTGNMVQFVSLPSEEQKKLHEQWKAGKKDWAQKFKPDGLDSETLLTPEKFDALEEGDRLWISWAPHLVHTVKGHDQTSKGKPLLVLDITNPKTGESEERYMHRSSAGDAKHEIHVLPEGALPKDPKSKAEAPKKPKKPKKQKKPAEISEEAKDALSSLLNQYNADKWLNSPGMPGSNPEWSDEDAPFQTGSAIEIEEGGYPPVKFEVMSGKLVVGPKGKAMLVSPYPGESVTSNTLIPVDGKNKPKMKEVGLPKKPESPKPEKTEAPKPSGKHKDRKKLVGKGVSDGAKVSMSEGVKKTFVPEGLSEEAKKATEKGLEGLTYGSLKQLASNVQAAVDEPEGPYAKALQGSGYTPGELSKMHSTIKRLLKGAEGRKYNNTVLEIANKYDLESEDADELHDFKSDRPGGGKALSDQQLMQKFLAKASPDTRERMQGMSVDDFMTMYHAIMADEEEEEG